MSTTVKGAAQGSNTWKAYITYDVTETDRAVTVTCEAGMMIESSGSTTRGFTALMSATEFDDESGTIAGATRKKGTFPILNKDYVYAKGSAQRTMTIKNVLSATGTTSTSTATFAISIDVKSSPTLKVKVGGNWVDGTPKIKVNGQWIEPNKIYVKANGQWVETK